MKKPPLPKTTKITESKNLVKINNLEEREVETKMTERKFVIMSKEEYLNYKTQNNITKISSRINSPKIINNN